MDLTKLTIAELQEQLRKRAVTAREIAEAHLKRIDERDPQVKAFLSLSPERALEQAAAIDRMVEKKQPLPPLAGVPMAIKDVHETEDMPMQVGSPIFEGWKSGWDAASVYWLRKGGALILGKTVAG